VSSPGIVAGEGSGFREALSCDDPACVYVLAWSRDRFKSPTKPDVIFLNPEPLSGYNRGDVDCDGLINIFDVVVEVSTAFRGDDQRCTPCNN